jgi:hypothetical protein
MEFGKLQSLVEFDLFVCFELGCLFDSILDLSQLERFQLSQSHKLENLQMEFRKLQSLVELNLFTSSKLGCLLDSIMDLSQLKTFRLFECHKLENLLVELGNFKA